MAERVEPAHGDDGGAVGERELVVAGGDGPALLELGEEVLDHVAGLVEVLVVGTGRLAAGFGRDHGHLAGLGERLEHPRFGIERLVRRMPKS